MSSKLPLPKDLEHAVTIFRDLTAQQVHRRPDGSIDIDFYRGCAKQERDLAIKGAFVTFAAVLVRIFRITRSARRNFTPALTPRNTG